MSENHLHRDEHSSSEISSKWCTSGCDYINPASSLFGSSTEDVIIDDINDQQPTSIIINYCRKKFIQPYILILGVIGLRPSFDNTSRLLTFLGHIQTVIIMSLLLFGYFLQFIFKYHHGYRLEYDTSDINITLVNDELVKSDALFHEIVNKNTIFIYFIPFAINFLAYLSAICVFRIADNEQISSVIERVFIILSDTKVNLVVSLWLNFVFGAIWLLLTIILDIFLVVNNLNIEQNFFYKNYPNSVIINLIFTHDLFKGLLIVVIVVNNLIKIIVFMSFCIQIVLLRKYLLKLNEKLLQHNISILEWMRELNEFEKFLLYINNKYAIPVCIYLVINIINFLTQIIILFKTNGDNNSNVDSNTIIILFNLILLSYLIAIPFYQVIRINNLCNVVKKSGHNIRVRPFVHHNTLSEDLDSIILYASTLKMSAKLFGIPIRSNYISFIILLFIIVLLTVGMYNSNLI